MLYIIYMVYIIYEMPPMALLFLIVFHVSIHLMIIAL